MFEGRVYPQNPPNSHPEDCKKSIPARDPKQWEGAKEDENSGGDDDDDDTYESK